MMLKSETHVGLSPGTDPYPLNVLLCPCVCDYFIKKNNINKNSTYLILFYKH